MTRLAPLVGALTLVSVGLAACEQDSGNVDAEVVEDEQFAPDAAAEAEGGVAFLLPEQVTPRWEGPDREGFEASMAEYAPNVEVEFFNALNDAAEQQEQAETAITRGADVLVVAAVDMTAAAVIVEEAEASDVPVIAYDRLIEDAPVDFFVTFDGEQVGRAQGEWLMENTEDGDNLVVIHGSEDDDNAVWFSEGYMPVLEDAVDAGTRTIEYEDWIPGWDPSDAQESMEAALTSLDNDVQGVLSANDGMAATIISALESQGMAGDVPVTGQDATEEGLQLVLRGDQGMSVFKDMSQQADVAAQISAALMGGEGVPQDLVPESVDNGELDVPTHLLDVDVIDDEDSVSLAIDAGLHELADICAGVPDDVEICAGA